MGLVDTAAWLFYAIAMRGGSVAIVTAITEAYPAVALMLGVIINRERLRWTQAVGASVAVGAALLLGFTL